MAAAAHASVVSLLNTIDQIQIHPFLSTCFDSYQLESLREKANLLLDFVENRSDSAVVEEFDFVVHAGTTEEEGLLSRIAAVAQAAEDRIEVEAADLILGGSTERNPSFLQILEKIIRDMDFIVQEVQETDGLFMNYIPPPSSSSSPSLAAAAAASSIARKKTKMVGFEGYVARLLDELTSSNSGRRILPIVGMGGIGKTTLARNVYEHALTVYHFDVRVWVTVSREFDACEVMLQALSCLGRSNSKMGRSDDEVGEELYKILSGRRYMVVLDDVWSVEAWEKIKFFFPENRNRSRIVVTTRQHELVDYFSSSAISVDFLDDEHSWDLFCDRAFPQELCPSLLEEIGKKIVKKCRGLPLAIVVIGGLLGKSPGTQEYWERIANDKSLILEDSVEGNQALSILYLSYNHLPVWLISCFLYLGLFPEDHQINVAQLIQLWIAEGYIKPDGNRSLEIVAESYIKELVDRSLLLFGQIAAYKKLQTCRVHDLVRELCIRVAEKENLYHVQRSASWFHPQESNATCERLRHLVLDGQKREVPLGSRLLRVFHGDVHCLNRSSQLVNLRFFMHPYHVSSDASMLPSSISLCWSLQTLILEVPLPVVMPAEVWKMQQLRHIEIWSVYLPDPPSDEGLVLKNLHTLKKVKNLTFSNQVCRRIPNIKDLVINYDFKEHGGENWHSNLLKLRCFNKLEMLNYSCKGMKYIGENPLQELKLPSSLKELILEDCHLAWNDIAMIASLPRLESLSLVGKAVMEAEWNFVEEEFRSLKHLHISRRNVQLTHWIAESSHFPVLERLSLVFLSELDQIPPGIGEIATLENIYLCNCSETATMSAVKILEEQENLGNQDLQLKLEFNSKTDAEMWRRKIGSTVQNLHISSY